MFSNPVVTKAGDAVLNTNTYAPNNGNLLSSTYGNNFIKGYMYDKYDRLTSVTYNGEEKFTYTYNAEGLISRHVDKVNGKTYSYTYDLIGRPVRVDVSDGSSIESTYNQMDLSTKTVFKTNGKTQEVAYTYSNRDNLPEDTIFNGKRVTNTYDGLTRLTSKAYYLENEEVPKVTVSYGYLDHATDANRTTGVVRSINYATSNNGLSLQHRFYEYDPQGNILKEFREDQNTGLRESYKYDSKNQLIRHDSYLQGKTFTYSYDNAGNILSKTTYNYTTGDNLGTPLDTASYQYQSNDDWGDKLTSYDGKAITYDAIGNMTSFDGKTYSWQGRELTGITTATDSYSYKYNAEGIRTEKTVNGVKTEYFLNGSQIIAQSTGPVNSEEKDTIYFVYDSQGQRVGLVQEDKVFSYMYNVQGDVIGIVDADTGNVLATYEYDAWGNCTLVTNAQGETIGDVNPFRYRGYYYDNETGFYYVSSRYYDPEIGRFISADTIGVLGISPLTLTDKNLYAYCDNNPVMRKDSNGEFWNLAAGAVVGATISMVAQVLDNVASGNKATEGLIIAAVSGALTGTLAATGANKWIQAAVSGVVSGVSDYVSQRVSKGPEKIDMMQVGVSVVSGAIAGFYGGDGVRHKNGDVAKAKKVYDYTVKGIKNRQWSGNKGSKYLTLASKNLGKAWVSTLNKTTGKYTLGTIFVTGTKKIYSLSR